MCQMFIVGRKWPGIRCAPLKMKGNFKAVLSVLNEWFLTGMEDILKYDHKHRTHKAVEKANGLWCYRCYTMDINKDYCMNVTRNDTSMHHKCEGDMRTCTVGELKKSVALVLAFSPCPLLDLFSSFLLLPLFFQHLVDIYYLIFPLIFLLLPHILFSLIVIIFLVSLSGSTFLGPSHLCVLFNSPQLFIL